MSGSQDIRDYLIGISIFTLIIVGGVFMIGAMVSDNPAMLTGEDSARFTQFNKSFNKQSSLVASVDNLQNTTVSADTDFGAFGVLNSLISTAWNSLTLTFESFSFMNTIFHSLTTFFGVPAWIPILILTIITIIILFAIFAAIFQR